MGDTGGRALAFAFLAGLAVWGGYSTSAFVAAPAHQANLLPAPATTVHCGGYFDQLCTGALSIGPVLTHAVARWWWNPNQGELTFFAWWSMAVVGAGLALSWFGRPSGRRPASRPVAAWRPLLRMALAFGAVLWLLFTMLSLGDNGALPYRRLFEPTVEAYPALADETRHALQENFTKLRSRNCLVSAGADSRGVQTFDLRASCIQIAFVTRVLPPLGVVAILGLIALGLGAAILARLGWRPPPGAPFATVAVVAGCAVLIAVCWTLARFGSFTGASVLFALVVLTVVGWRDARRALAGALDSRPRIQWRWSDGGFWLMGLLLSYAALNYLSVVRPFPIGWDDLGVYLNNPRLLAGYGAVIPQMGTFQWEYLTAIPFAIFGTDSAMGATSAMAINWAASLLAALAIYSWGRVYLPRGALLATLLFVTLPMVGQLSFADLKIDNAVFAAGAAALLCLFLTLLPPTEGSDETRSGAEPPEANLRTLVLAGALAGCAFSMKATVAMLAVAMVAVLSGVTGGALSFAGAAAIGSAALVLAQLDAAETSGRLSWIAGSWPSTYVAAALASVGVACLIGATVGNHRAMATSARRVAVFVLAFAGTVAPWLLVNNAQTKGRHGLLLDAPSALSTTFDLSGSIADGQTVGDIRRLPAELRLNLDACRATGPAEEQGRYQGPTNGGSRAWTLPWRRVMNSDTNGYHVTTAPVLLAGPLVLLLPWFWSSVGRWIRWLGAATALMVVQWVIFGHGIPWYGMAMFLGLCLAPVTLATESPGRFARWLAYGLIGVSVAFGLSFREAQYQAMRHHYEYAIGKVSPEVVAERVVPHYDDIREVMLERAVRDPVRPFAYRIGTFIAYFVPRSLGVLPLADNQLDFFSCLNQESDGALTVRRLKALGFNSIVFDTTTDSIESDPQGTLHLKVRRFLDFVNAPGLGLTVVVNDPAGGVAFLLLP